MSISLNRVSLLEKAGLDICRQEENRRVEGFVLGICDERLGPLDLLLELRRDFPR